MDEIHWEQVNITYPGSSRQERERHAIAHLTRVLPAAEAHELVTAWWFIRKDPWRIRYLPASTDHGFDPVHRLLTDQVVWTSDIYEPETHAFGGPEAMDAAHTLFHHDSRHLLDYLQRDPADRRERSLILCTALMRAAGLDLEEQGDVWAHVDQMRAPLLDPALLPEPGIWTAFTDKVRYLLLGTARSTDSWHAAFDGAGATLRALRETGRLTRGLRAVIAKHVIFHWNRIGLPAATQAVLAHAAKEAIFGSIPGPPGQQGPYGQASAAAPWRAPEPTQRRPQAVGR